MRKHKNIKTVSSFMFLVSCFLFQIVGVIMASSYKKLIVWQKAMEMTKHIYGLTSTFPQTEKYGLVSQIRRAAVSIPSNIAEGQGRLTKGEFKQFLGIARGSLYELETQILLAKEMNFLVEPQTVQLLKNIQDINRMLNGLIKSLKKCNYSAALHLHAIRLIHIGLL